jgi:ABC-type multidrug transport system ATPase subunit
MRVRMHQVMTVVKGLVKNGITICATIHSPTPYCFNLFDTLMILLRGNVVYFGENGANPYSYGYKPFISFMFSLHAVPARGGKVCLHVRAVTFTPLVRLAKPSKTQSKRGHGAQNLYRAPQKEAKWTLKLHQTKTRVLQ